MRILFVTQNLPYPLNSGAKIKSYQFLKALAAKHDVTLLSYVRSRQENRYCRHLSEFCEQIDTCLLKRARLRDVGIYAASVLLRKPFVTSRDCVREMNQKVGRLLSSNEYDIIHIDHLQMAQFVPEGIDALKVLDEHNVEWCIIERIARSERSVAKRILAAIEYPKLRQFEIWACSQADYVLTVTEVDSLSLAGLLTESENGLANPKMRTIPIGVDTEYFSYSWEGEGRAKCALVGSMYWPPNVDAAVYFCRDILPLARESIPELEFDIVGLKPARVLLSLERAVSGVNVTGTVADVRPYMKDCGVFVVPLRAGSGMRVKILNAMATGIPVVSTSVGCEGIKGLVSVEEPLSERDNRKANIWVADSPEQFSRAVVSIISGNELAKTLSRNGRELMRTGYDWAVVREKILAVYDEMGEERRRREHRGVRE